MPVYLLAWVLIGFGMGTGLYDAVFAALGRMYGHDARGPITNLTLFGGFASTICWPLSAYMIEHAGWRSACFIYAALHLFVMLPLQAAVVRPVAATANPEHAQTVSGASARIAHETLIFGLLAAVLSIAAGVGSIVVVHLLIFLQARGVDFATAVSLGTIFGPAQVGARVVERLFGSRYHPIWTMIASCTLMAIGLLLLLGAIPALVLTILLYGAGYGISWIGRGTLPLALFGPARFPRLMGKLAFPSLIIQAAGAVGRRAPDRGERLGCDHRRIDLAGVDQCGADRRALVAVPAVYRAVNVTGCTPLACSTFRCAQRESEPKQGQSEYADGKTNEDHDVCCIQ